MSDPTCPDCGCPMLPKGQRRKDPDDYRHARGCPRASKREHDATERLWASFENITTPEEPADADDA